MTYDFKCDTCGNSFEGQAGINDPAPACPQCGGPTYRLIGAPMFYVRQRWTATDDGRAVRVDDDPEGLGI